MLKNDLLKKFASNLSYAFVAQSLSLLLSVLMSLIVPKLLGVEQFAYWQLFIFYSGYVGLLHLGLPDGIYLRYGGTELNAMDKSLLGSQLRIMILFHTLISIVGCSVLSFFSIEEERKFVWMLVAIYMIITNAFWYLGFLYQAANKTKNYSIATIISKVSFTICVFILMFIKPEKFKIYVALYVVAQGLALLYFVYKGRSFVFSQQLSLRKILLEIFHNIKIGINLTFSNIVSSFIIGVGRVMIDTTQGISDFGMVSFAISLSNFFLQFISQISMVMFPMLRSFDGVRMKKVFVVARSGISYLLCAILAIYAPMKYLLSIWLPQYALSLEYLAILLPICVFDGKMQLLYNTYLKVLRKEKVLLGINLFALGASAVLCVIGAYVLNSMTAVVFFMVVAIAIRSWISNIYLSRFMDVECEVNVIWECVLSLVFVGANMLLPMGAAFWIYIIAYLIYCFFTKKVLKECYNVIRVIQ